jgi:hypothetical protein
MMTSRKHESPLTEAQKARLDRAAIGAGVVRIRTQSAAALRRFLLQQDAPKEPRRIYPVGYLPADPTVFDQAWWRSSEFLRVRERELARAWFMHGEADFSSENSLADADARFDTFWNAVDPSEQIDELHFAKQWFKKGRAAASSAYAIEQRK